MNRADSVAIVISRPCALARRMATVTCRRCFSVKGLSAPHSSVLTVHSNPVASSTLGSRSARALVFSRSVGSGRFPGHRSPGPEDGRSPTSQNPAFDWRGGAAGPRDRGVGDPSHRHFGTFHPLPRPGRPTGLDDKPGRQVPVSGGAAPANACGQYRVPSPGARSVRLGQSLQDAHDHPR